MLNVKTPTTNTLTLADYRVLCARFALLKERLIQEAANAAGQAKGAHRAAQEVLGQAMREYEPDEVYIKRLGVEARQAEQTATAAEDQFKALNREYSALEVQLRDARVKVTEGDLKRITAALTTARADLERLEQRQQVLRSQQPVVDTSGVEEVQQHRQQVLADLALGEADEQALRAADRAVAEVEIIARRVQQQATLMMDQANALESRVQTARDRVQDLEGQQRDLTGHYLRACLDQATEAAAAAFDSAATAWTRLRCLETLAAEQDRTLPRGQVSGAGGGLVLPGLGKEGGVLFKDQGADYREDMERLRVELVGRGVPL